MARILERPTITAVFTAACCEASQSFNCQDDALKWLMQHIRTRHIEFFRVLEEKGRLLSRSQNGCGYFDSAQTNGWATAQETFREAWRTEALEQYLPNLIGG